MAKHTAFAKLYRNETGCLILFHLTTRKRVLGRVQAMMYMIPWIRPIYGCHADVIGGYLEFQVLWHGKISRHFEGEKGIQD